MLARWRYEILLLATILVWGLNFPILKAALDVMNAHVVNAVRFTVSFFVLGVIYGFQCRRGDRSLLEPYRRRAGAIVFLGLFGFVCYQLFFIIGIDHTTSGTAALIMAGAPVWTALVGRALGFERLRFTAWIGLFVTLVGTGLIVLFGHSRVSLGPGVLTGNILVMAAALCWGVYTALSKPVLQHVTPSGLSFLGLIPALPILYAIGLAHVDTVRWHEVDALIWSAMVFSGALSSGAAFVTWSIAVKNLGSSYTAAFGNLVPVVALAAGAFLLGEQVTRVQILGGTVVLAGLYVMRRARHREQRATIAETV